MRTAYGINNVLFNGNLATGSGQTIAIVDAYNDPNIYGDLDTFDLQFSATTNGPSLYSQYGPASTFLNVYNEYGQGIDPTNTSVPVDNTGGWELEEALDVEWAHAIAPGATIALVEANSSNNDLNTAVQTSRPGCLLGFRGVDELGLVGLRQPTPGSRTASSPRRSGIRGSTFLASTGEIRASANIRRSSPNVIAVGGTSLYLNSDNSIQSEIAWSTGSDSWAPSDGVPAAAPAATRPSPPHRRRGVQHTGFRTIPDQWPSMPTPATGVAIYDTFDNSPSWIEIGGTSLSSPSFAGIMAITNEERSLQGLATFNSSNPQQALTALYSMPSIDFNDITVGSITSHHKTYKLPASAHDEGVRSGHAGGHVPHSRTRLLWSGSHAGRADRQHHGQCGLRPADLHLEQRRHRRQLRHRGQRFDGQRRVDLSYRYRCRRHVLYDAVESGPFTGAQVRMVGGHGQHQWHRVLERRPDIHARRPAGDAGGAERHHSVERRRPADVHLEQRPGRGHLRYRGQRFDDRQGGDLQQRHRCRQHNLDDAHGPDHGPRLRMVGGHGQHQRHRVLERWPDIRPRHDAGTDAGAGPSGPVSASGDQPTFTWSSVPAAAGYDIEVNDLTTGKVAIYSTGIAAGATSWTTPTSQALTPGHGYEWWVASVSSSGTSSWSAGQTFALAPCRPPRQSGPSGTIAVSAGYDQPTFTWSSVSAAASYDIEVNDLTTGKVAFVSTGIAAGATTWTTPTALTTGHGYEWWVATISSNGTAFWSAGQTFALAALPAPTQSGPASSGTASAGYDQPTFTWSSVAAAASYDIEVNDLTTGKVAIYNPGLAASATSWTTPATQALTPGHGYEWWVGTVSTNGATTWSAGQTFALAALPAPTPIGPSGTIPFSAGNQPTFTWSNVGGVAGAFRC